MSVLCPYSNANGRTPLSFETLHCRPFPSISPPSLLLPPPLSFQTLHHRPFPSKSPPSLLLPLFVLWSLMRFRVLLVLVVVIPSFSSSFPLTLVSHHSFFSSLSGWHAYLVMLLIVLWILCWFHYFMLKFAFLFQRFLCSWVWTALYLWGQWSFQASYSPWEHDRAPVNSMIISTMRAPISMLSTVRVPLAWLWSP